MARAWVPAIGLSSLAVLALLAAIASAPTSSADPAAPPTNGVELRLPPDIVYPFDADGDSAVVFRHSTHVEIADRKCTGCHPRPFLMLKPTHRTSHRVMNAGGSCGSCHDGKQAFSVREVSACRSCHSGRQARQESASATGTTGAAVPGNLPKPILYGRSADSPGRVTFRHATHMSAQASCGACHPKLFRMKALAAVPAAMHESGSCGKCHDGKSAFGVEDADACGRCHKEGKGTP